MTFEEICEKYEDEFLKFDAIPAEQRFSNRPDLHAFMLLDRLVPGKHDIVEASEHDEFFLSVSPDELDASGATEDQLIQLHRCGVRFDSSYGCLAMFA